jgi:inhibitor of cysteine peptidase
LGILLIFSLSRDRNKKMASLKRSGWFVWGLCFIFLSGLASCHNHSLGERAGEGENMKREKDQKVITHKENGREFEITVGETFQVSLPENPTTGYRWRVCKSGAPFIVLQKEEYVEPEEDLARPRMGRGGTKFLTFKAAKLGETELALRLSRSWEDESKFVDFFSVKLKIVELQK